MYCLFTISHWGVVGNIDSHASLLIRGNVNNKLTCGRIVIIEITQTVE